MGLVNKENDRILFSRVLFCELFNRIRAPNSHVGISGILERKYGAEFQFQSPDHGLIFSEKEIKKTKSAQMNNKKLMSLLLDTLYLITDGGEKQNLTEIYRSWLIFEAFAQCPAYRTYEVRFHVHTVATYETLISKMQKKTTDFCGDLLDKTCVCVI